MHAQSLLHWPHFAAIAAQSTSRERSVPLGECIRGDKAVREHLSEADIDKMLKDSFPASDPPSLY